MRELTAAIGRTATRLIEEFGYYFTVTVESVYWLLWGPMRRQPVRLAATVAQMREVGVSAVPIVCMLSFAIGVMLAIQGIHTLKQFGAETQVVLGIALSVTREFAPLITGVLVAGRSGSALAARIGSMRVSQEIDALQVMGINPVRFLAAPAVIALVTMTPLLALLSDLAALFGGAVFCALELGMSHVAFWDQALGFITTDDLFQGLVKSVVFGLIVAVVGVVNGFKVTEGAEGVGRSTTRAVVQSISYLVLADMLFTYFLNR